MEKFDKIFGCDKLSQQALKGFDGYKYSAIDTSPLSLYLMHPFWNSVVKIIPKTVAPNTLTFVGFLFTVSAFALLSWYDWDFRETLNIPTWVFAVVPLLIFLGYTLDGIDGKQARRTSTSGPLGELFDHGLDSWTSVLLPVCLYSIFGRTEESVTSFRYFFVLLSVFWTFYLTHWEKYITGTLFLPWGYDLSMLGICSAFLLTYWKSPIVWFSPMPFFSWISLSQLVEIAFYLSSLLPLIPVTYAHVSTSLKMKTAKRSSPNELFLPGVCLVHLTAVSIIWGCKSNGALVEAHPRVFYMTVGTVFSNITCRLVVSQMSAMRCSTTNPSLNALTLSTAASIGLRLSPSLDSILLHCLCAVVTAAHIRYGTVIVRQLCDHFHIHCFSIKGKGQDFNEKPKLK